MVIQNAAEIEIGSQALAQQCEIMADIVAVTGAPPLRRDTDGFGGLARIIVSQQLSVASARAIWSRVEANLGEITPASVAMADDAALRLAGLSAPKIRTLRAIATAAEARTLDLAAIPAMDADAARAHMVAVKGIGPWTADIYLMFCVGLPDVFAPGDLALQEAIRIAFRLSERPTTRETLLISERWRPWRAVAARLLWAYYAKVGRGAGVVTAG